MSEGKSTIENYARQVGLQTVDTETGQCTYRAHDDSVHIYNTTPEIAQKLQYWLAHACQLRLHETVPELSVRDRCILLYGRDIPNDNPSGEAVA